MGGARGAAIFMLEPERSRSGACPQRSRCCFSGTINVYFTPIPLTNPTTFCSRTAESEDVKRGMEIGAYPSWSPHPLNGIPHPLRRTVYGGLESVLGIGEGVPR